MIWNWIPTHPKWHYLVASLPADVGLILWQKKVFSYFPLDNTKPSGLYMSVIKRERILLDYVHAMTWIFLHWFINFIIRFYSKDSPRSRLWPNCLRRVILSRINCVSVYFTHLSNTWYIFSKTKIVCYIIIMFCCLIHLL